MQITSTPSLSMRATQCQPRFASEPGIFDESVEPYLRAQKMLQTATEFLDLLSQGPLTLDTVELRKDESFYHLVFSAPGGQQFNYFRQRMPGVGERVLLEKRPVDNPPQTKGNLLSWIFSPFQKRPGKNHSHLQLMLTQIWAKPNNVISVDMSKGSSHLALSTPTHRDRFPCPELLTRLRDLLSIVEEQVVEQLPKLYKARKQ